MQLRVWISTASVSEWVLLSRHDLDIGADTLSLTLAVLTGTCRPRNRKPL